MASRDEALLEDNSGWKTTGTSTRSSPRLDASDITNISANTPPWSGLSATQPALPAASIDVELPESNMRLPQQRLDSQPLWGHSYLEDNLVAFPMDSTLLLGDVGYPSYQTGDPVMFWDQLQID